MSKVSRIVLLSRRAETKHGGLVSQEDRRGSNPGERSWDDVTDQEAKESGVYRCTDLDGQSLAGLRRARVATAGSLTTFHCDTESSVLTIPTQAGGQEQQILSGIGFFG